MAGFTPVRKTFRLQFTDEDMAGLEVVMRRGSMDGFVKIAKMAGLDTGRLKATDPATLKVIDELLDVFSAALVSWNVEDDDGNPVPATREGVGTQDDDFVLEIIRAWVEARASVSLPLGQPSNGGATTDPDQLLMVGIPMEALSESHPN